MSRPRVTAIIGGIGSGKSVVSRILMVRGYPVYDCDSRARDIMDNDPDVHALLCRHIHPRAVIDGAVDRPLIASVVFSDPDALSRLNKIVHTRLVDDFKVWTAAQDCGRVFVESAIPDACPALWPLIDDAWDVTAPAEIRIRRVMARNNLTREQVCARMAAQSAPQWSVETHPLKNDGTTALLPRMDELLRS